MLGHTLYYNKKLNLNNWDILPYASQPPKKVPEK
jgi:hypothetical protein